MRGRRDVGAVLTATPPGSLAEAELDRRAGALRSILMGSQGAPARWRTPPFGRDLRLARRQLAPILDRALLADSFGREAGNRSAATVDDAVAVLGRSAMDVAYTVRWLELGDEQVDERDLLTP